MKEKALATTTFVDRAMVEVTSDVLIEPVTKAKLGGLIGFEAIELVVFIAAIVRIISFLQVSPTTRSQ